MDIYAVVLLITSFVFYKFKKFAEKDYEQILKDAHKSSMKRFHINHMRWDLSKEIDIIY
jgi:hypothetical protein